jgi:hypothetical protein
MMDLTMNASTIWEEQFKISIQEPRQNLGMEQVDEEEKAAFFDMIKAMIIYKPEERSAASKSGNPKWMTKWAMPELLIANTFNWPAKIDMLTLCFFEATLNVLR